MAVDKLVDSTQLDSDLTSVANAIRAKGGTSASLSFPSGFVTAIGNISTGTDVSDTTLTADKAMAGYYFHIANGTKVQGTLTEWNGGTYGPQAITFTIDGITYNAYEGMDWTEWVASSFNPNYKFYIKTANQHVRETAGDVDVLNPNSSAVLASDTVVSGRAYTIDSPFVPL